MQSGKRLVEYNSVMKSIICPITDFAIAIMWHRPIGVRFSDCVELD